jgi:hypothetical protein
LRKFAGGSGQMIAAEKTDGAVPKPTSDGSLVTVKVYTRHTHIARSETGRTGRDAIAANGCISTVTAKIS